MQESQIKQAWITSLRLLAATPKSARDLEKKLADKGYESDVIQQTILGLQEKGLLNDSAYAQSLMTRYVSGQPSGKRKILFELKRKGIPEKIREAATRDLTEEGEMMRARELALARWERLKNLLPEKRKKRLYDLLIRRGFEYPVAREILEELEGMTDE